MFDLCYGRYIVLAYMGHYHGKIDLLTTSLLIWCDIDCENEFGCPLLSITVTMDYSADI